mmetsp:Transcript_22475/g.29397  ORF Transcript_22475/g.29397 Transcript_22475/m.29397 type:complete len:349 (-) Transcript_22475:242-1288(-)
MFKGFCLILCTLVEVRYAFILVTKLGNQQQACPSFLTPQHSMMKKGYSSSGLTRVFQAEYELQDCLELQLCSWLEVEDYVHNRRQRGEAVPIVVPVGSTEQHGPTGLIGTDAMTAQAAGRGLAAATGAMLGPTISIGMAMHHTGFPGTISLRPSTFVNVIKDHVWSLQQSNFTHIFFVNGHGGNIMPIFKAFKDLGEELGEDCPQLRVASWYMGNETSQMVRSLYGDKLGMHATPDEVAITQHLYPGYRKDAELRDDALQQNKAIGGNITRVLEEESGLRYMEPKDFRRRFPDGRMGSYPQLASPERGAEILKTSIMDLVSTFYSFTNTKPSAIAEPTAAAAQTTSPQ